MPTRSLEKQIGLRNAKRFRNVGKKFLAVRVNGRVSSYYLEEIATCIDFGSLLATVHLTITLLEIWIRDLHVNHTVSQIPIKSRIENLAQHSKIDREIEGVGKERDIEGVEKFGISFKDMVKKLHNHKIIDDSEKVWLNKTYDHLRNPLLHGISGRIVDERFEGNEMLNETKSKDKNEDNRSNETMSHESRSSKLLSGPIIDPKLVLQKLFNNQNNKSEMELASMFLTSPDRRLDSFQEFIDSNTIEHLENICKFFEEHPIPIS